MAGKSRIAGLAGLLFALLAVLGSQSGSGREPPATGHLQIPVRGASQKSPVAFSHRLHEKRGVACQRCHHEYQGRRNVWSQGQPVKKCQSCHGLHPQARNPDLKNAMHRQCKGCHLQLRQQRRQAGPVECRDCHRST